MAEEKIDKDIEPTNKIVEDLKNVSFNDAHEAIIEWALEVDRFDEVLDGLTEERNMKL